MDHPDRSFVEAIAGVAAAQNSAAAKIAGAAAAQNLVAKIAGTTALRNSVAQIAGVAAAQNSVAQIVGRSLQDSVAGIVGKPSFAEMIGANKTVAEIASQSRFASMVGSAALPRSDWTGVLQGLREQIGSELYDDGSRIGRRSGCRWRG